MLISHLCKFIYLKTVKTGGTSVEIYFEPYCVDPKTHTGDRHGREAQVSDRGVVGSRGFVSEPWYNHMPAQRVRELVGEDLWRQYYKFCVVRNPFDKVVSHFWFDLAPDLREELRRADFPMVRETFLEWIQQRRLPIDQQIYTINDEAAVDYFVRYEHLHDDLKFVCHHLGLPWQPERLGRYKSEFRVRKEYFADYYNPRAVALVREEYVWELDYFSYPTPSS